jgi:hypothetical protein
VRWQQGLLHSWLLWRLTSRTSDANPECHEHYYLLVRITAGAGLAACRRPHVLDKRNFWCHNRWGASSAEAVSTGSGGRVAPHALTHCPMICRVVKMPSVLHTATKDIHPRVAMRLLRPPTESQSDMRHCLSVVVKNLRKGFGF